MSITSIACAAFLQVASPCAAAAISPNASSFSLLVSALPDEELSGIRGQGAEFVGLDEAGHAAAARQLTFAFNDPPTSLLTREMFDNWNQLVAVPLIAQAVARAGS